jgi:hypothetical protein
MLEGISVGGLKVWLSVFEERSFLVIDSQVSTVFANIQVAKALKFQSFL